MKFAWIPVLCLLIALGGCQGKSALKYNNLVVNMADSLNPLIQVTEDRIHEFAGSQHWDSIASVSKRMETQIDTKLQYLQQLEPPAVNKAAEFKQEVLRYFKFLKDVYTGYYQFGIQTSDAGRTKQYEQFSRLVQDKNSVNDHFITAQQKFAEANGLRMRPR